MSLIPNPPADFEPFWRETAEEALGAPLDFQRKSGNAFDFSSFLIETYTFRGIDGDPRHGWIAVPATNLVHPSFLWIPPYGRESLLPNRYGTREGFVSGSLNFFGHDSFHQEKYQPSEGYFAEGAGEPKTWIMRRMFQDAVLAARVLREQPEVDPNRFGAMGMSQGGGFAIWLGAWIGWVRAVCADMPFLGGVSQTLGEHVYRYPLKELIDLSAAFKGGLHRIRETIRYFDTLNQATFCRKPTHISLGERDPAVKPASVEDIYEALPGEKKLRRYGVGHDWFPDMVENNRQWLVDHLSG